MGAYTPGAVCRGTAVIQIRADVRCLEAHVQIQIGRYETCLVERNIRIIAQPGDDHRLVAQNLDQRRMARLDPIHR